MKKEIEVKAKVESLHVLKNKLEELGCAFNNPAEQKDTIFVNFDGDFTKFMPNTNFLRIRETNNKILFTLKRPQSNELDCIEKEIEVSDKEQLKDMLELMGYHEAIQVHKIRTKTQYKDMEICLDDVRGLGTFIEVEKITDGDGEIVQNELLHFLESLGVSKEDRIVNGYDTLMYLKIHNSDSSSYAQ
jgi:adenylate cyclase class 2